MTVPTKFPAGDSNFAKLSNYVTEHVGRRGDGLEVKRINASGISADVIYLHSHRNWANKKFIGRAMRQFSVAAKIEPPVSRMERSGPIPASGFGIPDDLHQKFGASDFCLSVGRRHAFDFFEFVNHGSPTPQHVGAIARKIVANLAKSRTGFGPSGGGFQVTKKRIGADAETGHVGPWGTATGGTVAAAGMSGPDPWEKPGPTATASHDDRLARD